MQWSLVEFFYNNAYIEFQDEGEMSPKETGFNMTVVQYM